tara:strand:- start:61 stop:570 length:510 start_codon:yes stop_codon:yes gene_type:complete
MIKKTLSELAVYQGDVNLPKGLNFNVESLRADIIDYSTSNKDFPFSKNLDILDTYIRDYFNLYYKKVLIKKHVSSFIIDRGEQIQNIIEADPMNLKDAADFVMLYGVKIKNNSCKIIFEYDDNRIKNMFYEEQLNENSFLIFPSTTIYQITKNEFNLKNYILKIYYESH